MLLLFVFLIYMRVENQEPGRRGERRKVKGGTKAQERRTESRVKNNRDVMDKLSQRERELDRPVFV